MNAPTPEMIAAYQDGDYELFTILAVLNTGQAWGYPPGERRLMTQDLDTILRWREQGLDVQWVKEGGET